MAVQYNNTMTRTIYYQLSTTNKSFLNMHYYLKDTGRVHNKFMLALLDPDLAAVDPFDKRLPIQYKAKIAREVLCNYWYFIRECVRIPDSGGAVGGGVKYELHRGNMALNFCLTQNINTMLELPRQRGKTVSAICWYLYLFNYGTSNSEIVFLNKKLDDSKLNLQRFRDIRAALPSYLQMDKLYDSNGKLIKAPNTVETLQHPSNRNKIRTVPSARNKVAAANLLRGRTIPLIWADEYAFIPYNNIIYMNTVPAFKTAANHARANHTPYGILITTTPGILTTEEGTEAFMLKNSATPFSESWYDCTPMQLQEILDCNTQSDFVYIRYTYQQLGCDETWFKEICKTLRNDWEVIRREVLLEWAESSSNCPFRKDDLEIIKAMVRQPIRKWPLLGGKYELDIYDDTCDIVHYPPIMGVDVSSGYNQDSSTITIIDSKSTRVIGEFNCNYISVVDLARVIYEIVTKYMPNAVVNIERNGGFGSSVLSHLVTTSIKRNLFFEIKDSVIEERFNNGKMERTKRKVKKYGSDSTATTRECLIEILRNRVENHKDKFVSHRIFDEMQHMEVKKSGKVEHSAKTHDDQVFSYLWALYVWYEGQDLMENWGIRKDPLRTDADLEEAVLTIEEQYKPILEEVQMELNEEVNEQINSVMSSKAMLYADWLKQQYEENERAMQAICQTPIGREAYARQYSKSQEGLDQGLVTIPDDVFGEPVEDSKINYYDIYSFKQ